MINILLDFKFWLESKTESKPMEKRTLSSKIVLNGLKLVDTIAIVTILKMMRAINLLRVSPLKDNPSLPIVSLTTFPGRLDNVWMVIYCMYKQTVKPGKIVVTLANSEIKGGYNSLPESLKLFADKGVEFLFVNTNLRPHNKYYYTRQKYPDRLVITIDDDLLYYSDTIQRLMDMHVKFPDAVCSNRVQEVGYCNGEFLDSNKWNLIHKQQPPSHYLLGLGYSAVLYPPSFVSRDLYNAEKIKKLCLMADDMWLKVQELIADVKVVNGRYYAHPVTIPTSQKIALQKENDAQDSRNNKYLLLMNEYYNLQQLFVNRYGVQL